MCAVLNPSAKPSPLLIHSLLASPALDKHCVWMTSTKEQSIQVSTAYRRVHKRLTSVITQMYICHMKYQEKRVQCMQYIESYFGGYFHFRLICWLFSLKFQRTLKKIPTAITHWCRHHWMTCLCLENSPNFQFKVMLPQKIVKMTLWSINAQTSSVNQLINCVVALQCFDFHK